MTRRTTLAAVLIALLAGLNVYQYVVGREEVREYVNPKRFLTTKWFGLQTLQHPFDVWTTQEIIWEIRPDVIVETGTFRGGSAALWATILEHANPDGSVISIDIEKRHHNAFKLPVVRRRVRFLTGSSTDPKIVSRVSQLVKGKKVMVILDSLHTKEHVLDEMNAYAPLVAVGSYLIVQDTHLGESVPFWWLGEDAEWTPGPLAAVREFLAANDAFEIDKSREQWASTNNLDGFLERVK